jgi:hypothetical protein
MAAQTAAQRQARYIKRLKERPSGGGIQLDAEAVIELRALLAHQLAECVATISSSSSMNEIKRTAAYRRALNELSKAA